MTNQAAGLNTPSYFGVISFYGLLITIAFSSIIYGSVEVVPRSVVVTAVCIAAVFRVIDGILRSPFRLAEPLILLPVAGVLLIALLQIVPWPGISSELSADPYATRSFIAVFGSLLMAAEILFFYIDFKDRLAALIVLVAALGALSSAFGIYRAFFLETGTGILHWFLPDGDSYAQFINRNHFALLVEMSLGLLLGVLVRGRLSKKYQLFGWTLAALMAYSLVTANSRGGILGLAVISLFTILVHTIAGDREQSARKNNSSLRTAGLAIGLSGAVLGSILLAVALLGGDAVVTRIERIGDEVEVPAASTINRRLIWKSSIELIKERPLFGSGFGSYPTAITRFDTAPGNFDLEQAHNDYLEILANGGIAAFLLFVIFALIVTVRISRNLNTGSRLRDAAVFGSAAGLFAVLIHSFVDFGLHVPVNAFVFVVLIVIATARPKKEISQINSYLSGYLTALLYIFLILFAGSFAVRQGFSNYYSSSALRSGSMDNAESALHFQPNDPDASRVLGMMALKNGKPIFAIEAFERAVSLRSGDLDLWLLLGDAHKGTNNFEEARRSYQSAIDLAPNYTRPAIKMAGLLREFGRPLEAFEYLRFAAARDRKLFADLIESAGKAFPGDAQAIEDAVRPATPEEKSAFADFLIKNQLMTENVKAFLLSDQVGSKDEFIEQLIHSQRFRLAREVWLSKHNVQHNSPAGGIHDGGFENLTSSDDSGFGWYINQDIPFVSLHRDSQIFHSGANSLKIKFAGEVPTGTLIVSQLTYVESRTRYQLQFYVRSSELVSAGMPEITVNDAVTDRILGVSGPIKTGSEWKRYSVELSTIDTPAIRISLFRPGCSDSPCPIFGEMNLDDFLLVPR